MDSFNPLSAVISGGKISFRMGLTSTGIEVHYVNVDMLASGPPDALFDDSVTEASSGGAFNSALRFGSFGPKIYDYILVSVPYSETAGSGLDDSSAVTMNIPVFYDENWNVIWNSTNNGTEAGALIGNYSHYEGKEYEWGELINESTCTTNVDLFNSTNPCYIDTAGNKVWIRIPHFSGTSPNIQGSVVSSSGTETPSGGSGGTTIGKTYKIVDNQLEEGYEKSLGEKDRIKFEVGVEGSRTEHSVKVTNVSSDSVSIEVSSQTQTATLVLGQEKKFDVDSDGFYDISVKLQELFSSKAKIIVRKSSGEVPSEPPADTEDTGGKEQEPEETGDEGGEEITEQDVVEETRSLWWLWVILGVVILGFAVFLVVINTKKKKRR
jgi:hypothetical protein